jgi:hypothetical protein
MSNDPLPPFPQQQGFLEDSQASTVCLPGKSNMSDGDECGALVKRYCLGTTGYWERNLLQCHHVHRKPHFH